LIYFLLQKDFQKAVGASLMGASLLFGQSMLSVQPASAEIDYDGVKYLGGGDKIDVNNANIRAYLKVPGLYPSIASKLVKNGPYKTVADVEK
jgi:photosystem II PsbU protein